MRIVFQEMFKVYFSMSISGTVLAIALLTAKRFYKNKISRQWQYYIWLAVILRLLLPLQAGTGVMGRPYQIIGESLTAAVPFHQKSLPVLSGNTDPSGSNIMPDSSITNNPAADNQITNNLAADNQMPNNHPAADNQITGDTEPAATKSEKELRFDLDFLAASFWVAVSFFSAYLWLAWILVAAFLLVRKITAYQSFLRYLKAGANQVDNLALLDLLSVTASRIGIKKPVELCIHPFLASPMLVGLFHPCIVLPSTNFSEQEFSYIALHELTHYRRLDVLYKWMVQAVLCLHWFNPAVYFMCREINNACEFSCDEAVLAKIGYSHAQDYGKILLDAMAAVGKSKAALGTVTLSENKQLLKERLCAIMNFKKQTKTIRVCTGVLTLCIAIGSSFIGIYPAFAASYFDSAETGGQTTPKQDDKIKSQEAQINKKSSADAQKKIDGADTDSLKAEARRYYHAGSLPLFQAVFPHLGKNSQKTWLNKFYKKDEIAFFSVSIKHFDKESAMVRSFAKKAYQDGNIAFFSVLSEKLSKASLEAYLDKALDDGEFGFQAMLYDALNDNKGWEQKQAAMEEDMKKEYEAYGITKEGTDYYYKGELVHIFLDYQPQGSVYTLDMNPQGTANIKITRKNGKIEKVSYLTKQELKEWFGTGNP